MKKSEIFLLVSIWAIVMLAACKAETKPGSLPTATQHQLPSPFVQLTSTQVPPETATNQATMAPIIAEVTHAADPFVLGQAGPYFPGKRYYDLEGFKRTGVQVDFTVWYPSVKPEGFTGPVVREGQTDRSGEPYPLIVMSAVMGDVMAPHLVSYGFVVAGAGSQGPSRKWANFVIDYPREILAMLNQIAAKPPEGLEGMIDSQHVGAMGYSFDGLNSLFLSGARVDPSFYAQKCAQGSETGSSPSETAELEMSYQYFCALEADWDGFAANAGEAITSNEDGLWQPITDDRILAVMPMAPEGVWLFGEGGLAAVNRPVLMICGTQDDRETDYQKECAYIFEHLGAPEKGLISFIDQEHGMVFDEEPQRRMRHFITAFFGNHLQGREEYAQYFSSQFVQAQEGLAWGVYEK